MILAGISGKPPRERVSSRRLFYGTVPQQLREIDMNLILNRNSHKDKYCDGVMTLSDGTVLFSMECPWRDNQNKVSCVPPGKYDLIPYMSPRHGATWYLKNDFLQVGDGNTVRSYCELHSANWARQLEGCIAFGLEEFPLLDPATNTVSAAVEESVAAIDLLRKELGEMSTGHTLTIY